ncbi:MAG: V-type ATP synthase subunit I [Gammaproteobacteria bacterium]
MFRPVEMIWVDLLVDRSSVTAALDILGRLQVIELRQYDRPQTPFEVAAEPGLLERLIAVEHELESVAQLLPEPDMTQVDMDRRNQSTELVLPDLERRCCEWLQQAKPIASQLRKAKTRLEELEVLVVCLESLPPQECDVALLAEEPSRALAPFVALGSVDDIDVLDARYGNIIGRAYPVKHGEDEEPTEKRVLVVGVTDADALTELERRFHSRGMRFVRVPAGLKASSAEALEQARGMLTEQQSVHERLTAKLEELNQHTGMAGDMWLLNRHRWVNETLADSLTGKRFVWLGGWVPETRYGDLVTNLQSNSVPFLINRESAQEHGLPPVQLDNPRWIQRFETFVHGFGVPAADEIDPSPLLAIMAPLMFGYMFGDVGHGAVLIVIGYFARRYVPVLELLIAGGISSVAFGFLYGSLFANEHILPALWLTPMEEPLWVLGVPIVFGFVAILASMLLYAVQALWRGRISRWWAVEAPIVMMYLALPLSLISITVALLVVLASLAWLFTAVSMRGYRVQGLAGVPPAIFKELAELLEIVFQLVINTLSFARLGAFALAHAGLSAAVIALAEMPGGMLGKAVVFIIGNAVVIALEGLVVSIQTTRLVMFEFFRRFLIGEGRPFRPLTLPNHSRFAS